MLDGSSMYDKSLSNRDRYTILNKVSYRYYSYDKSHLVTKTLTFLHLHLRDYVGDNIKFIKYAKQPSNLFFENNIRMVPVPSSYTKLHIVMNRDLSHRELLVDAFEMLMDCIVENLPTFHTGMSQGKLSGIQYVRPCHKSSQYICNTFIDYDRTTANVVIYPMGDSYESQHQNIIKMGQIILAHFQHNWDHSVPVFGATHLDFNQPLFPELKGDYHNFLQYATNSDGGAKVQCIEKMVDTARSQIPDYVSWLGTVSDPRVATAHGLMGKIHKNLIRWWTQEDIPDTEIRPKIRKQKKQIRQIMRELGYPFQGNIGCDQDRLTMPREISRSNLELSPVCTVNYSDYQPYNWAVPSDIGIDGDRVRCGNAKQALAIRNKYGREYCESNKANQYTGKKLESVCLKDKYTGKISRYCSDKLCFH